MRGATAVLMLLAGAAWLGYTDEQFNADLDYAQVTYVRAVRATDGVWRFDATVRHADTGWDHYADAWQIVEPEGGEVIAERVLLHPHVNEQPFTRSLTGVDIPRGLQTVRIRAKCNVHGFGGRELLVELTPGERERYAVEIR